VIDFDDIWQKYSKVSTMEFAPDTENYANFDAISMHQH